MHNIKPGRGPSMGGAIGGVAAAAFGLLHHYGPMKQLSFFVGLVVLVVSGYGNYNIGIAAEDNIRFSGHSSFYSSYDSRLGPPGYISSGRNEFDDSFIATRSGAYDAISFFDIIDLGSLDVVGYVATGIGGGVEFGPNGGVFSLDGTFEPDRISDDYRAKLQVREIPPEYSVANFNTLPNLKSGDNWIFPGIYRFRDNITTDYPQRLIIPENCLVVWILEDAELYISGEVEIQEGARLLIYTNDDLTMRNVSNLNTESNTPEGLAPSETLIINGISEEDVNPPTIEVTIGSVLAATIHAPKTNVVLQSGSGYIFKGALVGHQVDLLRSVEFWFDRALADTILIDSDGDGMNDGDEVDIYHTDPNDPDSDDDALIDGDEVELYGSSPTSSDTDGDGDADGLEIFQGTSVTSSSEHHGIQNIAGLTGQQGLSLDFRRSTTQSTVVGEGQWSTDLSNWYSSDQSNDDVIVTIAETSEGGGIDYENIHVEAAITDGTSEVLFFRLALSPAPVE